MQSPKRNGRLDKERKRGISQRKSCDTCHKSKTKCDRKRPVCSTCSIFNRKCTYKHRDEHGAPSPESPISNDSISISNGCIVKNEQRRLKTQNLDTGQALLYDSSNEGHDPMGSLTTSSASEFPADALPMGNEINADVSPASIQAPMLVPASDCAWCLRPGCHRCQQTLGRDDGGHLSSISTQQLDSNFVARALLDAMASGSDQDSSTILAAIRIGTPWTVIHSALISDIYAKNGLAYALEISKASLSPVSSQDSPGSLAEDIKSEHYHPNRKIFDHLRYEARPGAQEETPQDIVGTLSHKRRLSRHSKKPPFLRTRTCSSETDGSHDLRIPIWSVLPLRLAEDTDDPFGIAFAKMKAELATGIDVAEYCGEHAYLSVLVHSDSEGRVPRLSRMVADLNGSIMPYEAAPSVTHLAIFWLHWCLWSWLLAPTPESFERLPKIMRPTPWQICSPHTFLYNFAVSAALRDHLCRSPLEKNSWVTEAASTIQFTWPKTTLHALSRNSVTKALDLSPECKHFASQPENWTLGPSVRAHLPNIDSLMTIRPPQQG